MTCTSFCCSLVFTIEVFYGCSSNHEKNMELIDESAKLSNSLLSYILVCNVENLINPRRACAARVTVVGSVCLCVCLCVCLLSHISPTKHLFVLKTLSRTQRAKKVKKFVGICLKRLRSRVMPRNMSEKANMLIIPTYPMSTISA